MKSVLFIKEMAPTSFVSLLSSNCTSLLGACYALWELCTHFLVDWDLWVRRGMIRGERFIPVTVQRLHSLSLRVYPHWSKRKVFFQVVEREMDFSFFFFFWYHSLLVLHRTDVLLMTSKASDSVPVNIRHIKRPKLRNSDELGVS